MRNFGSPWQNRLKAEHRYIHKVVLPRHPDHVGQRDPRRVWIYDCGMEFTSVEDEAGRFNDLTGKRIYRFANESDAMLFVLKWGGTDERVN